MLSFKDEAIIFLKVLVTVTFANVLVALALMWVEYFDLTFSQSFDIASAITMITFVLFFMVTYTTKFVIIDPMTKDKHGDI